ncbi:hypothetical protein EV702DRAFT_1048832 [Suillus placidus]|uniref:Uncharacterized protein n=1 Tax=Suillus placidus TaxID=48579 RepID=A0A9P7CZL4_9AGAM|nr:hypothetical protein EV702DRAFT_1048832 [Suillus placidus]
MQNWLSRRSSAGAVRTYSQSVLNDPAICNAHFFNPNVVYPGSPQNRSNVRSMKDRHGVPTAATNERAKPRERVRGEAGCLVQVSERDCEAVCPASQGLAHATALEIGRAHIFASLGPQGQVLWRYQRSGTGQELETVNMLSYSQICSFHVNKPGAELNDLKGGVVSSSILTGALRLGPEVEIHPQIVTKG